MPGGQGVTTEQQLQYASSVLSHSKRSKDSHFYPGTNYRQFADFLVSNPSPVQRKHADPTNLVTVHQLANRSGKTSTAFKDNVSHHPTCGLPPPVPDCSQLVFMQGFMSPRWVRAVGAQYKVDPEFFRRHMGFLQAREDHRVTYLPSATRNMFRLRVTEVFTREIALTQEQLLHKRTQLRQEVRNYQRQLRSTGLPGDTIVRKVSAHHETLMTLEYDISICIKSTGHRGWIALVWTDVGRNLSQCNTGPWIDSSSPELQAACEPVIQYRPKLALEHVDTRRGATPSNITAERLLQTGSHLPEQYGSSLDPELMRMDSIYALSEIFSFVANSESQFLDAIGEFLRHDIDPLIAFSTDHPIDDLKYIKAILDEHLEYLNEVHRALTQKERSRWPSLLRDDDSDESKAGVNKATTEKAEKANNDRTAADKAKADRAKATVEETISNLIADYEALLHRTKKFLAICIQNISIVANDSMLYESRKSLDANKQTRRLTLLAFCYLPLSLTTAVWGMNFKEMGTGSKSFAWVFATAIPIILISAIIYFWAKMPWSAEQRNLRQSRRQQAAMKRSRADDTVIFQHAEDPGFSWSLSFLPKSMSKG